MIINCSRSSFAQGHETQFEHLLESRMAVKHRGLTFESSLLPSPCSLLSSPTETGSTITEVAFSDDPLGAMAEMRIRPIRIDQKRMTGDRDEHWRRIYPSRSISI